MFKNISDDFLVAIGFVFLKYSTFAFSINFFNELIFEIFTLFFLALCEAVLPIFLHSLNNSAGILKGSYFHFYFFLTSFISSSPNGLPCDEALPPLFGDP